MKKAVIYIRAKVDLRDCNLMSVEAQIQSCNEFARKHGVEVAGVRTDIIAAQAECKFDAWRAIVNDESSDYDCVIVHDYARIGRDIPQAIKDRMKLKSRGVRIISVTEYLSDDYDDALFYLLSTLHKEGKQ